MLDMIDPELPKAGISLISRKSSLDSLELFVRFPLKERMAGNLAVETGHHEMDAMVMIWTEPDTVVPVIRPAPASRNEAVHLAEVMTAKLTWPSINFDTFDLCHR